MKPTDPTEQALLQAQRALALADRDHQAAMERERTLRREISELRQLIEGWYRPELEKFEHANADLRRRCCAAETALRKPSDA